MFSKRAIDKSIQKPLLDIERRPLEPGTDWNSDGCKQVAKFSLRLLDLEKKGTKLMGVRLSNLHAFTSAVAL